MRLRSTKFVIDPDNGLTPYAVKGDFDIDDILLYHETTYDDKPVTAVMFKSGSEIIVNYPFPVFKIWLEKQFKLE